MFLLNYIPLMYMRVMLMSSSEQENKKSNFLKLNSQNCFIQFNFCHYCHLSKQQNMTELSTQDSTTSHITYFKDCSLPSHSPVSHYIPN